MSKVEYIRQTELTAALLQEYRQYLTGHLSCEQPLLKHLDDDIEIGISHYREFSSDKPHMHPVATEHGYILQGSIRMRLLDGSKEEYEFNEGDFFLLRPGVGYATKNKKDTRILFIKAPGGNDKTEIPIDKETQQWLMHWD